MSDRLVYAALPSRVTIVEVGARDGLQNEAALVDAHTKSGLIRLLAAAGLRTIEAGAFVSPKWVPQMATTAEVLDNLPRDDGISYPVLVPNLHGLQQAMDKGCRDIAVFAAASEAFSQKNINCSVAESIERFRPVIEQARDEGIRVRGYVSCVVHCPYGGSVAPADAARVAAALYNMGCTEISLGDTTGAGTPADVRRMIEACAGEVPVSALAGHFHDSYGMAIANILTALDCGLTVFDSSVSGLGGCPYAPGATGNVATEDVAYLMHGMGIDTGIDMERLLEAASFIDRKLGRSTASRAGRALSAGRTRAATHA